MTRPLRVEMDGRLIETPEANLSRGMRHLNGVYTQRFNAGHHRVGHVFQGRFKAVVVDRDGHLLELCRYVVLNPVRAGMVEQPEDWAWNSYRCSVGLAPGRSWLSVDWLPKTEVRSCKRTSAACEMSPDV